MVDFVESNALMPVKSELTTISDYTERYILLSIGLLYMGIAPVSVFIVWLFFILDGLFARLSDCYTIQRPRPEPEKLMTAWNNFAELMIVCLVFSNSFLLYQFSVGFRKILERVGSENRLGLLILLEHFLLALVLILKYMIPDIPSVLFRKFKAMKSKLKLVDNSDPNSNEYLARIAQLEDQLSELGAQSAKERVLQTIREHDQPTEVKRDSAHLADFLEMDTRQHFANQLREVVESALKTNLEVRLFRESFLLLERAILHRKLAKILGQCRGLHVCCVECAGERASIFCTDCKDHFCHACFVQVHKQNRAFKLHATQTIALCLASCTG